MKITFKQIGIIHTPYNEGDSVPIQSRLAKPDIRGTVELFPECETGLKDLEGFSHCYLIYYFHLSSGYKLLKKPFLDTVPRGIFAIRHFNRPNPIGFSIVRIEQIDKNLITFSGVDMFEGTPLLDIKPYSPVFDNFRDTRIGWMDRYTEKEPDDPRVKSREEWLHE